MPGIDRAEHTTERPRTGAFRDDRPHQPGVILVNGFEPMVVMHLDGEEPTHPLPPPRRVKDLHPKRGANAACECERTGRAIREGSRRLERHALDVFRPRGPRLDVREMVPCLLQWRVDGELSSDKLTHGLTPPIDPNEACPLWNRHASAETHIGR